jgi:hypothetical protein
MFLSIKHSAALLQFHESQNVRTDFQRAKTAPFAPHALRMAFVLHRQRIKLFLKIPSSGFGFFASLSCQNSNLLSGSKSASIRTQCMFGFLQDTISQTGKNKDF